MGAGNRFQTINREAIYHWTGSDLDYAPATHKVREFSSSLALTGYWVYGVVRWR